MSNRDDSKAANRSGICDAAEAINREEGVERLMVRRLAAVAGVSLRTPYDLFGSKADVQIALLDRAVSQIFQFESVRPDGNVVKHMLDVLGAIEMSFANDEGCHRANYTSIMSSENQEARNRYVGRGAGVARMLVAQAVAYRERRAETDVEALGHKLASILLAMLDMWGAETSPNRECIAQVRCAWLAALPPHCAEASQSRLACAYSVPTASASNQCLCDCVKTPKIGLSEGVRPSFILPS